MKVNQEEKVDRYGIYPHIRVSGKMRTLKASTSGCIATVDMATNS